MTEKQQHYNSIQQTIEEMIEDLQDALMLHKQTFRAAPRHAPAFIGELEVVERGLAEVLDFLTHRDE